jgi:hypothetical protein
MSNYTFTFKKGDIIAEFKTTDKQAVERQFPLWVASADEAAKKMTSVNSEEKKSPESRPPVVQTPVPEVVKEQSFVEPEAVEESLPVEQPSQPMVEQQQCESEPEVVEVIEAEANEDSQVFDKASDLLKTINTIQNPVEEQPVEEVTVDFEKVLESSIENPTFEPNQTKDDRFLSVVASKNTSDRFHYLIITAYYLLEYEKMERFSLKQINAKLMNNLSRVVDHTILREAINQDFIEVVPDLTGASEAAEYRLTGNGEDFFFNGIN